MRITLLNIGKTKYAWIENGLKEYKNRLKHYIKFESIDIPESRKKTKDVKLLKDIEGKQCLSKIDQGDYLILLDERGKEFTSVMFANHLNRLLTRTNTSIYFVTGGAYGFSEEVYNRGNELIALSKFTFSHQMVRLIFIEQLYRAMTIIRGEPYHHS